MSNLERRRLLSNDKRIEDFIIFDTSLKAGEIITNSYSNISNKGYIDVSGGTYTTGGKKSKSYALNWGGDETVWTKEEAEEAFKEQYGVTEIKSSVSSDGQSVRITTETPISTHSTGGSIILGSYDFTKYKTLKFTVTSYNGAGYFILNQNAKKGSFWGWGSSNGTDIGKQISINGKKEYLIDIKNYTGIYNLKFVSNSTSGFKIINVYLEG